VKGDIPRRSSKNDVHGSFGGKSRQVFMRVETFEWVRFTIVLDILSVVEEPIQTCVIYSGIWMTCAISQLVSRGKMNDVLQQT